MIYSGPTSYLASFNPAHAPSPALTTRELLSANRVLLMAGSAAVVLVISAASIYRMSSLRGGGGSVARELGGVLVGADTRDPSLRRLRNVVEEIALASGVPVPEIYVLEGEPGINAFAAGFSPSDAAIAVTRGSLDSLTRSELQGVIAHEFSHIFNGDMRINVRMIGFLFGVLVVSLIGQRIMSAASHGRRRSGTGRNGSALVLFGFGIMITGYAGLFFSRWIKSALSRQREYLADASAVQYTRDVSGIGGALKKIAVSGQVPVYADMEEISHMLFGQVRQTFLFATHPPIVSRIRRLEPGFKASELEVIARTMNAQKTWQSESGRSGQGTRKADSPHGIAINPRGFLEGIGRPGPAAIIAAATLLAGLSEELDSSARSLEWAPAVLLYTLLDPDADIMERQVSLLADRCAPGDEARLKQLVSKCGPLHPSQRLPLFELVFPTLKRRTHSDIRQLLSLVDALIQADERVDTFEYMLARAMSVHMTDAMNPTAIRSAGKLVLADCETEIRIVLSVLARHGHEEEAGMQAAYERGLETLGFSAGSMADAGAAWHAILDRCLARADGLRVDAKELLVTALLDTAVDDQKVLPGELEMVRAISASLHVPLPIPG